MKLVASLEGESDVDECGDLMSLVSALGDTDRDAGLSSNWAENWNRIIPSWREVALIIVPTLAGAYCGFRFPTPDMGPVFFQSVVAAVIPFEIAFFSLWFLSYRRHKGQALPGTGKVLPKAPAIVTIALILLISILAITALFSCVAEMRSLREPATASTPFHVASVTKVFTASLAVMLHEQGVVDLDQPVATYLPEDVRISTTPELGATITLRQLASHTSGLPRGVPGKVQLVEGRHPSELNPK